MSKNNNQVSNITNLMSINVANRISNGVTKKLPAVSITRQDELPLGIKESIKKSQKGLYLCSLCNSKMIGTKLNIESHVNGQKHLSILNELLTKKQTDNEKKNSNEQHVNSIPKLTSLNNTSSILNGKINDNKPDKNTSSNSSKLILNKHQLQDENKLSFTNDDKTSKKTEEYDYTINNLPNEIEVYSDPHFYQCDICLSELWGTMSVSEHLGGSEHKRQMIKTIQQINCKKISSDQNNKINSEKKITEKELEEHNSKAITKIEGPKKMRCSICHFKLKSIKWVRVHLQSDIHKNNLDALNKKTNNNINLNNSTNITKNSIVNSQKKLDTIDTTSAACQQYNLKNTIIEINSSLSVVNTTDSQSNAKCPTDSITLSNDIYLIDKGRYQCKICLCRLDSLKSVKQHLEGQRHFFGLKVEQSKLQINEIEFHSKSNTYQCNICLSKIVSLKDASAHLKGKRHLFNKSNFLLQNKLEKNISTSFENLDNNENSNSIVNTIDNSSSFDLKNSNESDDKIINLPEFIVENNITGKYKYKCTLCYVKVRSHRSVLVHLKGLTHNENLNNNNLIKISRSVNKYFKDNSTVKEFKDNSCMPKYIYYNIEFDKYLCQLCETIFDNFSSINEHIYSCKREKKSKVILKNNSLKEDNINNAAGQHNEEIKINVDNTNDKDNILNNSHVKIDTVDEKKSLTNGLSSKDDKNNFKKLILSECESIKEENIVEHYDDFDDFVNNLKSSSNDDNVDINVENQCESEHNKNIERLEKISLSNIDNSIDSSTDIKYPTIIETSDDITNKKKLPNDIEKIAGRNRYQCSVCLCRLDGFLSVMQHLKGQKHLVKKNIIKKKDKKRKPHDINIEALDKKKDDTQITTNQVNHIVNNENKMTAADTASALRHQYDFPNAINEINSSLSSINITPLDMNNSNVNNNNNNKPNKLLFKKYEDPRKLMMNAEDCEICHIKVPGGIKGMTKHRSTSEHIDNMNKVFGFMETSNTAWSLPTPSTNTEFNISPSLNLNNLDWPTVADAVKSRGTTNISQLITSDKITEPVPKYPCHICDTKTVTRTDLHAHMSSHFIERFVINSETEINKVLNTKKDINTNLENKDKVEEEEEENIEKNKKEISDMQLFLNDLLGITPVDNNNNNNNKDESSSDEDDNELSLDEKDDESTTDENITKDELTKLKKQKLKRKMIHDNVIYNGPSKNLNIYKIDNDKIENIKKSIVLSLILDEKKIWCFICNENIINSLQTYYEHICSNSHIEYYNKLIEYHEKFETFHNQFSDLDLAVQYIHEISDSSVQCLACNVIIMNKFDIINEHIEKKNHQDKMNIFNKNSENIYKKIITMIDRHYYNCQVYWCVLCNTKYYNENEFLRHLDNSKHKKLIKKYPQKLIFDYCVTCAALWYGFIETYSYHCEGKMHKYHKKDNHFFVDELPNVINDMLKNPEFYADKLLNIIDNNIDNEKKKEKLILKNLSNTIKNKYPQAQHYIFGSRLMGLALENSDIDIYLDCKHNNKSSYYGTNKTEVNEMIKKVNKCLLNNTNDWHIKRIISDARVPIIKLVHRSTLIDCDISFNNGLAVEKTNLVKLYCDNNINCRKLILFIKKWISYCDLTGITSYTVAWLVIYYLQVQSIIPPVIDLINQKNDKRTIAGWNVSVGTDIFNFTEIKDFKELLINFFIYYSNFDYKNDVICPLLGKAVKKILFLKPNDLPVSMKNYVRQLDNGHMLEVDYSMCVQDPFDLGHNISDTVDKFNVYRFKTFCSGSVQILEQ